MERLIEDKVADVISGTTKFSFDLAMKSVVAHFTESPTNWHQVSYMRPQTEPNLKVTYTHRDTPVSSLAEYLYNGWVYA
jgi:hypothetical protein